MIGVVCPEGQRNFVAEFFEFFKTPWEFYRPERSYDVLLATDVPPQGIEVKLLVVYSSAGNEKRPISNSRQSQDTYVEYEDTIFPVYGRIALIDPQGRVTFFAAKSLPRQFNTSRRRFQFSMESRLFLICRSQTRMRN